MNKENEPQKTEEKQDNNVIIVGRGSNPVPIKDIWFKITHQASYTYYSKTFSYMKCHLIKNGDISSMGTEISGDAHSQVANFVIKATNNRTIILTLEVGEKFLKVFEMVNCCVSVEHDK
jgi:hypothetical protein